MALLHAYADATRQHTTDHGWLPLHVAAKHQRGEHGVAFVAALLAAFRRAAKEATNDGSLPLHIAVRYQSGEHGVAVVTTLLEAYTGAAACKDMNGDLPLHLAVLNENSEVMAHAGGAAGENTGSVTYADSHTVTVADPSEREVCMVAVVAALLAAYPHGAKEKNKKGCLPLHVAQRTLSSEHPVLELLQAAAGDAWQLPTRGRLGIFWPFCHLLSVCFWAYSLCFFLRC